MKLDPFELGGETVLRSDEIAHQQVDAMVPAFPKSAQSKTIAIGHEILAAQPPAA